MALWHCGAYWAAHAVLCVSAVRERVRGVRFVCSACRSRGKQSASSTSASIFMCASLIDFAHREISRRRCFVDAALAPQLHLSHHSTSQLCVLAADRALVRQPLRARLAARWLGTTGRAIRPSPLVTTRYQPHQSATAFKHAVEQPL